MCEAGHLTPLPRLCQQQPHYQQTLPATEKRTAFLQPLPTGPALPLPQSLRAQHPPPRCSPSYAWAGVGCVPLACLSQRDYPLSLALSRPSGSGLFCLTPPLHSQHVTRSEIQHPSEPAPWGVRELNLQITRCDFVVVEKVSLSSLSGMIFYFSYFFSLLKYYKSRSPLLKIQTSLKE